MNETSRIKNSSRNMIYGFLSQGIVLTLSFFVRIIFLKCLNETYLGVNGLFSNVLSVLSLAEMGFGTAMTYNLYKPLSQKDEDKILSLMALYAKVYKYIGIFVAIVGICIIPFLNILVNNVNGIEHIEFIYLLFLLDSVLSYFFAYRRAILNADQRAYICSQYRYIFVIFKSILQIFVLLVFKNFYCYLSAQILSTFLENIFISKKTLELYPFLKRKDVKPLSFETIDSIKKDVSALILSKVSNVSLHGTDNIIISVYAGVNQVGLLSNYTLISGALTMIISQISSAIIGSLGNFIASEDNDRHYEMFKRIDFMYYMIYSFCFICMFVLFNPFISLVFGSQYTFSSEIVFVFCLNFLIEGMLQSLWNFRTTMGLFVQGKYRPILAAGINIVMSLLLVKHYGVLGVLLGTTLSRVLVNAWYDPYLIFKYGLKRSSKSYFINYLIRVFHVGVIATLLQFIKVFVFDNSFTFVSFFIFAFVTATISIICLIVFNIKDNEYKYFYNVIKNLFIK